MHILPSKLNNSIKLIWKLSNQTLKRAYKLVENIGDYFCKKTVQILQGKTLNKPYNNLKYCLKIQKSQEIAPVTVTVGPVYSERTRDFPWKKAIILSNSSLKIKIPFHHALLLLNTGKYARVIYSKNFRFGVFTNSINKPISFGQMERKN